MKSFAFFQGLGTGARAAGQKAGERINIPGNRPLGNNGAQRAIAR